MYLKTALSFVTVCEWRGSFLAARLFPVWACRGFVLRRVSYAADGSIVLQSHSSSVCRKKNCVCTAQSLSEHFHQRKTACGYSTWLIQRATTMVSCVLQSTLTRQFCIAAQGYWLVNQDAAGSQSITWPFMLDVTLTPGKQL